MSKTFVNASAFPLQWLPGFHRTKHRESSRFSTSLFQALENVNNELKKFAKDSGKKVESIVISSNYSLTDTQPDDPGVCVYFVWDGESCCIPIDRYNKVECNLQAIFKCIGAKRTMLRHGGINLVKTENRGLNSLPAPTENWRSILNLDDSVNDIAVVKKQWKKMISDNHPDRGGDDEFSAKINKAWKDAQEEL